MKYTVRRRRRRINRLSVVGARGRKAGGAEAVGERPRAWSPRPLGLVCALVTGPTGLGVDVARETPSARTFCLGHLPQVLTVPAVMLRAPPP